MRYEDTPELFGNGAGFSTGGDIKCDICGYLHNEGEDEKEEYNGEFVCHTNFAGLTVCECCYERIESEVLSRMEDILPWYRRILDDLESTLKKRRESLTATGA